MGGVCSSSPDSKLKRFFRCSRCHQARANRKLQKEQQDSPNTSDSLQLKIESNMDPQITKAFYAVADDPAFISRAQFEETVGHSLGSAIWRFLQGDDKTQMNLEQFRRHGKWLTEMRLNTFAQMEMSPHELLKACLESCDFHLLENESSQDIMFLHKLAHQMGQTPEQLIAWKERNCPRLFQSLHEHLLNIFLGIPKSVIEESKLEESKLLDDVQMFFLKHNLPRKIFFERPDDNEGPSSADEANTMTNHHKIDGMELQQSNWTKLLDAQQGKHLTAQRFEDCVFPFEGSTVSIYRMTNGELFALALDQQWKNSIQPFGGPYTVLLKFEPEFQRIEVAPPALHCDLRPSCFWSTPIYFNGGLVFAVQRDFANVKSVEVWGCARSRGKEDAGLKIGEEELKIIEKRKTREGVDGKKPLRANAMKEWAENPDKQLLEMAGFTFSDKRKRGGNS